MSNNQALMSKRDRYLDRIKAKYPDREFADDEAVFGQAYDDYDEYDNKLMSYQEREASLSKLFASDPRGASFLIDWRNGEDPIASMIRRYGDEFREALDDPDKQESIVAANKEFAERVAQESDYEQQYQVNVDETISIIDGIVESGDATDDEVNEAMTLLTQAARDALLGKYSLESIMTAIKAIRYDEDVEQADQIGEVRGRNSKIEERLRQGARGDGTAALQGTNSSGASRPTPNLGALDRYGDGTKDIWERGGEKRTRLE